MSDKKMYYAETPENATFDINKATFQYSGFDKEKILFSNYFDVQPVQENFLIRFYTRSFIPHAQIDIHEGDDGRIFMELGRNNCIDFRLQSSLLLDKETAINLNKLLNLILNKTTNSENNKDV